MRTRAFLLVLTGWAAVGCGGEAFQAGEPTPSTDASSDVAHEAAPDAAPETASDVANPDQTVPDSAPDALPEAAPDVFPDTAPDAPEPEAGCAEGVSESCYEGPDGTMGIGVCIAGLKTCASGTWGQCEGQVVPSAEVCNGLDDDCDGVVDANCSCTPGESENCGTDTGECSFGVKTCQPDGTWGECENSVGPTQEICGNTLDENCDGIVEDCAVCIEAQPVNYPAACGANCKSATPSDPDCDGMVGGDPTTTCNALQLFEGFVQEPDATTWVRTGTTQWECGGMLLGPGATLTAAAPSDLPPTYITEARVKLKEAVAGNWSVGISSAVDTNQRRTCELWVNSSYTAGKLQLHTNVKTAACDSGTWTQNATGLDATAGKVYILRSLATAAGVNTCQVLDETGTQVLLTASLNCTFATAGKVNAYASVRAAVLDYVSVYSW